MTTINSREYADSFSGLTSTAIVRLSLLSITSLSVWHRAEKEADDHAQTSVTVLTVSVVGREILMRLRRYKGPFDKPDRGMEGWAMGASLLLPTDTACLVS